MYEGLSREEAEKSWYVNNPEAPETMNRIYSILYASLNQPS